MQTTTGDKDDKLSTKAKIVSNHNPIHCRCYSILQSMHAAELQMVFVVINHQEYLYENHSIFKEPLINERMVRSALVTLIMTTVFSGRQLNSSVGKIT